MGITIWAFQEVPTNWFLLPQESGERVSQPIFRSPFVPNSDPQCVIADLLDGTHWFVGCTHATGPINQSSPRGSGNFSRPWGAREMKFGQAGAVS